MNQEKDTAPAPLTDELPATERLLNRAAFISGLTYEMYQAEVSDLQAALHHWRQKYAADTKAAPAPQQSESIEDDEDFWALVTAWANSRGTIRDHLAKSALTAYIKEMLVKAAPAAPVQAEQAAAVRAAYEKAKQVALNERDEFREQAAKNNGRESDFAFGSVNSAERIWKAIDDLAKEAAIQAPTVEQIAPSTGEASKGGTADA